jgi:hypothetical protein
MAAMSVNSAFGKFFTDAQLPPDQTRALRDLLIDREVTGLEASMEAWSGNADARKVQEQMEQTRAKKAAINDQIKALLGPDGMAQFEEYGRSQPHRTMVSRFEEQLSPDAALSPAQERRLVDALKQEVNNFKFTVNFSDEAILKENPAVIFSEERVRLRIQEQERLDQNCLASAKDILSPDQLEALARYLGYQRQAVGFSLAVQARVLGGK